MEKDKSSAVTDEQETTFTIRWKGELGRGWMNIDNLKACLFSDAHIGGTARDKVTVE